MFLGCGAASPGKWVTMLRRNVSSYLQMFKFHESAFSTDPEVFKMKTKRPFETSGLTYMGTQPYIPEHWNTSSYSRTLENSVLFQNTRTQRHIPEQWNTASYSRTLEHSVILQKTGTHRHIPEHWNTSSYSRTLEHSLIFQNTGTHRHIPEHCNTASYSITLECSVIFQKAASFSRIHRHIPEHWNFQLHLCENLLTFNQRKCLIPHFFKF